MFTGIVEEAVSIGLDALTLYTFSTENWCRPAHEIKTLFSLLHNNYVLRIATTTKI